MRVGNNERLDFQRGDVIAMPSWTPFEIEARGDAVLFECTDEILLRKIELLREEFVV